MRKGKRALQVTAVAAAALAVGGLIAGWKTPAERAAVPVLERNAEARGGLPAWRKVRSMSMAGTMEAGVPRDPVKQAAAYVRARSQTRADARRRVAQAAEGGDAQVRLPFLLEMARPGKSRVEITFRGEQAVQVYDGRSGWKLRPFLGRREVEPFSDEELRVAARQSDLDGPLLDADRKGSKVELLGKEPVDGREAFKLHVTSRAGQIRNVWVDAETYLEVKVDGERRMDGRPRPVFTTFRDWRPVDGLLVPHLLETSVEGVRGSEKIRVESVALNPSIDDGRFTRPEGAGT